jgi:hypothetical protein
MLHECRYRSPHSVCTGNIPQKCKERRETALGELGDPSNVDNYGSVQFIHDG